MSDTDSVVMPSARAEAPIRVGEHFSRKLRYSTAQIVAFARLSMDTNPLHQEASGTHPSASVGVIASGQQTSAHMMGLVASHFSRHNDGVQREMLCLNFNFSFKAPIYAETDIDVRWFVSGVEFNTRLGGWIGQLNGSAFSGGTDCVVARGTILVKRLN